MYQDRTKSSIETDKSFQSEDELQSLNIFSQPKPIYPSTNVNNAEVNDQAVMGDTNSLTKEPIFDYYHFFKVP